MVPLDIMFSEGMSLNMTQENPEVVTIYTLVHAWWGYYAASLGWSAVQQIASHALFEVFENTLGLPFFRWLDTFDARVRRALGLRREPYTGDSLANSLADIAASHVGWLLYGQSRVLFLRPH